MNRSDRRLRKSHLLSGVSVAVALMAAPSAQAQDGGNGSEPVYSGPSLENVVVTARRQAENLQQTPIAVSAFTGNDLKAQTAVGLIDLQYQTPGLTVQPSQTAIGTLNYQIRGQFQVDSVAVLDAPIGLYQDGVYTGSHVGSGVAKLLDVDRVEVLKGPQGTLYGRNTTGGAISIYTKLPVHEFEAEVTAGAGNDERYNVDGILNIPLVKDIAALRLVASRGWDGGYGTNYLNGDELENADEKYVRATLLLDTSDTFQMIIRGDYSQVRSDGPLIAPFYLDPAGPAALVYGIFAGSPPNPADLSTFPVAAAAGVGLYSTFQGTPGYPYVVGIDNPNKTGANIYGGSVTMSKELWSTTLKSITSYRRVHTFHPFDFDGTPLPVFSSLTEFGATSHLFTQEFQLNGNLLDDRMKYVLGAFYLDSAAIDLSNSFAILPLNPRIGVNDALVETESTAVFGQATYDITSSLHFTGGLRWTSEKRDTLLSTYNLNPGTLTLFECNTPAPAAFPTCQLPAGVKDTNISYLAGLDWNFTDDVMFYIRTARGFKSGGVNERVTVSPLTARPFESEVVTDYEVGIKSEFFSRRVRLNAALFRSDYDELQRALLKQIGTTTASVVQNAGKATIDGFELEGQALPLENLSIRASASWIEPTYDEYVDLDGNDVSYTKFPLVSKWTYSFSGAYTIPLNTVDLRLQLDYSYRSDYNLSPLGSPTAPLTQEGYGLLNGQVAADFEDLGLTVRGYVKNITDEFYWAAVFDTSNFIPANGLGAIGGRPSRPRTYGVELTKRF